jgi:tRNA threonylcarbamoyladenosine biosynthesis protein TsaB
VFQIAINSAIEPYSISILEDEKLLNEFSWSFTDTGRNNHFEGLDFIMRNLNLNLNNMNFITILSGPGSFTGLRIGFTFAKTINFVFKKPVVAVNSFEVIKESINLKDYAILISAGLKEIFWFEKEVVKIIKFEEIKKFINKKVFVFPEYYLFKEFNKGVYIKLDSLNLGKIGYRKFIDGKFSDYKDLNPLYLREAETIFKKFK